MGNAAISNSECNTKNGEMQQLIMENASIYNEKCSILKWEMKL